jgi:transposase
MAEEDMLLMDQDDLKRLSVIEKVLEKRITQVEAGVMLELSDRQVRRVAKRIEEEGKKGILHKSRGKPSGRATSEEKRGKILRLCRERYIGFSPTLASEKLFERDKIAISRELLRGWFIEENISYRKRKGRKHRKWRQRKEYVGEMVQMDGSEHDWFEGRGPVCVLMGYIDDATGEVFARFYAYEGTMPAMKSFKGYIRKYGLPLSVYLDKHSTYKSNKKLSIEEELSNTVTLSQFGRALGELGVNLIYADSPQAKGRVERLFRTFQDRLIKEMRLTVVEGMEEGNEFLEKYLPVFNRRFKVEPAKAGNMHRPIPKGVNLGKILCIRTPRFLRNDFTIAHENKLYQVEESIRGREVIVEERINGLLFITYKGRALRYHEITQRPQKIAQPRKIKIHKAYIPPQDHPWRCFWTQESLPERKQEEVFAGTL